MSKDESNKKRRAMAAPPSVSWQASQPLLTKLASSGQLLSTIRRIVCGSIVLLGACAVFGSGCATQNGLPDPSKPVGVANTVLSTAGRLQPGVYYASFRPDLGVIRYFTLNDREAGWAGSGTVELGNCTVAFFAERIVFDHQHKLDIFPPCRGGVGVLQFEAGRTGRLHPFRTIITRFPRTAWVVGDVSPSGNVAVGYSADAKTHTSSSNILVYDPSAVGNARPFRTIPVYTRGCSEAQLREGPGQMPGSPSQISFVNDSLLIAQIGPTDSEACGHEYLERFSIDSAELASWLVPGKLASAGGNTTPISATPGFFATTDDGSVTYGAYIGSAASTGRNGGITYDPDASGFQPFPRSVFTDAFSGLGGTNQSRLTIAIGVDHRGNVYLQSGPGGSVVAIFAPSSHGNVKPLRTVHLPPAAIGWPGTFVEIPSTIKN